MPPPSFRTIAEVLSRLAQQPAEPTMAAGMRPHSVDRAMSIARQTPETVPTNPLDELFSQLYRTQHEFPYGSGLGQAQPNNPQGLLPPGILGREGKSRFDQLQALATSPEPLLHPETPPLGLDDQPTRDIVEAVWGFLPGQQDPRHVTSQIYDALDFVMKAARDPRELTRLLEEDAAIPRVTSAETSIPIPGILPGGEVEPGYSDFSARLGKNRKYQQAAQAAEQTPADPDVEHWMAQQRIDKMIAGLDPDQMDTMADVAARRSEPLMRTRPEPTPREVTLPEDAIGYLHRVMQGHEDFPSAAMFKAMAAQPELKDMARTVQRLEAMVRLQSKALQDNPLHEVPKEIVDELRTRLQPMGPALQQYGQGIPEIEQLVTALHSGKPLGGRDVLRGYRLLKQQRDSTRLAADERAFNASRGAGRLSEAEMESRGSYRSRGETTSTPGGTLKTGLTEAQDLEERGLPVSTRESRQELQSAPDISIDASPKRRVGQTGTGDVLTTREEQAQRLMSDQELDRILESGDLTPLTHANLKNQLGYRNEISRAVWGADWAIRKLHEIPDTKETEGQIAGLNKFLDKMLDIVRAPESLEAVKRRGAEYLLDERTMMREGGQHVEPTEKAAQLSGQIARKERTDAEARPDLRRAQYFADQEARSPFAEKGGSEVTRIEDQLRGLAKQGKALKDRVEQMRKTQRERGLNYAQTQQLKNRESQLKALSNQYKTLAARRRQLQGRE